MNINQLIDSVFDSTPNRSQYEKNLGDQVGSTGYIDFIKCSDIDHPLMYGKDDWNRPFLVIKYTVEYLHCVNCKEFVSDCQEENCRKFVNTSNDENEQRPIDTHQIQKRICSVVTTLFQRYSDSIRVISVGSSYVHLGMMLTYTNCLNNGIS